MELTEESLANYIEKTKVRASPLNMNQPIHNPTFVALILTVL